MTAGTTHRVAALARYLYVEGPGIARVIQHWRPYIFPFELLLEAVPAGSRVLDIGCGSGLFLGLLGHSGRISTGLGIDISAPAIALATQMTSRLPQSHEIRFLVRDVSTLPPSDLYDVVSLLDVLHHIPPGEQRRFLDKAIDRVVPGGYFIYKDMVTRPMWRALANRLHDLLIARQWIHHIPLEKVIEWAKARGCVVLEQRRIEKLWYGHEMVIFRSGAGPVPP